MGTRRNLWGLEPGQSRSLWWVFGGALAVLVAYAISLGVLPAGESASAWFVGARLLIEATACGLVVVRVIRIPRERVSWTVLAVSLGVLVAGDAITALAPVSPDTLRWLSPGSTSCSSSGCSGAWRSWSAIGPRACRCRRGSTC